jgi:hypothetical protein
MVEKGSNAIKYQDGHFKKVEQLLCGIKCIKQLNSVSYFK